MRTLGWGTAVFVFSIFIAFLNFYARIYDAPPDTKTFLDLNGEVIGTVNPAYDGFQTWAPVDRIPKTVIDAFVKTEDRFFHWHHGINPAAIVKAAFENLTSGKIRRGGSTITQQLAKNLIQEKEEKFAARTWGNKAKETVVALGLELRHSKSWILERYLNSIYFGRRTYGVAAAAEVYFGKELGELTGAEIDFLAGLPKAPNRVHPPLNPLPSREGKTPSPLRGEGRGEGVPARHFIEWAAGQSPDSPSVRTTLDLTLQKRLESAIKAILEERTEDDPLITAGAVVIDVETGGILAMVGSRDYYNDEIKGQVNGAVALRQPGSTLKPFTYFAAFSKGFSPSTIITDEPQSFLALTADDAEAYIPQNFDRRFHGDVTVREALGNSYNVPAVATLNEIGLSYYHDILRKFGFTSLTKPPLHYGLAVTLGAGEVSLLELTNAYAALARGGRFLPYRWSPQIPPSPPFSKGGGDFPPLYERGDRGDFSQGEPAQPGEPVLPNADEYASLITDILTDPSARLKAFGFNEDLAIDGYPVAVKTGTSYNHRDNWTVGYTPKAAVGVWVGHADGSPLLGTTGRAGPTGATGAAPVWHAVVENVVRRQGDKGPGTKALEGAGNWKLEAGSWKKQIQLQASSLQLLPSHESPFDGAQGKRVTGHLSIQGWRVRSPLPHARFRLHPYLPPEHQKILAEVEVTDPAITQLTWFLDGEQLTTLSPTLPPSFDTAQDRQGGGGLFRVWLSPDPGNHTLTLVAPDGRKQTIPFHIMET